MIHLQIVILAQSRLLLRLMCNYRLISQADESTNHSNSMDDQNDFVFEIVNADDFTPYNTITDSAEDFRNNKVKVLDDSRPVVHRVAESFVNQFFPSGFPYSVNEGYLRYTQFRALQHFSSAALSVLSTQSLLYAAGLRPTPAQATVVSWGNLSDLFAKGEAISTVFNVLGLGAGIQLVSTVCSSMQGKLIVGPLLSIIHAYSVSEKMRAAPVNTLKSQRTEMIVEEFLKVKCVRVTKNKTGQPRRHLLTTGWSIFVSQKNLVSGDAVLFLRGEGGELRLGTRRATRPRNILPDTTMGNLNSYSDILASVSKAVSTNSTFHVFYSPRSSRADFIVPYAKYMKSVSNMISIGARFKMKFCMDESHERRFSGVVTGVGDFDSYKWRNSKWRCLKVRWDEDIGNDHQERISPWEIDLSGGAFPLWENDIFHLFIYCRISVGTIRFKQTSIYAYLCLLF